MDSVVGMVHTGKVHSARPLTHSLFMPQNEDEFKFMEDLSKERATMEPRPVRSDIIKRCHSDAEKEFFFMMVLTVKLELATSSGATNSKMSDVSPQNLWVKAQEESVALHQFHGFIRCSVWSLLFSVCSSSECPSLQTAFDSDRSGHAE